MDTTSSEQFFDCMCRTCMHELVEVFSNDSSKPEQQWQSVWDKAEEFGSLRIFELLVRAIPHIEVHTNDKLPKKICRACLEQLQTIYRFQKMCVESDKRMRQLIIDGKADLEVSITAAAVQYATKTNEIPAQDSIDQEISQSNVADPLHGIAEEIDRVNASDHVKNEAVAGNESNVDYSDDETLLSPVTIIPEEVMMVKAEKDQKSLLSSICPICNKSFAELRYMKSHLKRHKDYDELNDKHKRKLDYFSFKCDICNRYFHEAEFLHKHRLDHNEKTDNKKDTYTCELCNKSYNTQFTLAQHKRNKHSVENEQKAPKKRKNAKQHPCEICNKNFNNSTKLKEHLNTHTGERPFLCPECGKAFSKGSYLKQHRIRHGAADAFECPLCPRKFRCMNDVSKHKVIHLQNKKHVCDICGVGFIKTHQLAAHKRYHNPIKPYKCDYCDMRFVSKYNNRSHMRTHTGEKPWKCKYCEGTFARSSDLMQHLRKHIGKNVYRCEFCPSAFRLATELREHIVIHKNEDEETRERNMKALKEEDLKLQLKLEKERAQEKGESDV